MSYQLRKKSLPREAHRVARKELEGVLKQVLAVADEHRSEAIHDARKHLKKLRALIRLLRPGTGDAFYKRENAALRKAAQRMSPIRDAHVRVQTIKKVIAKSRTRRAPAAFARVRSAMTARLDKVLAKSDESDWRKQVATDIERALCRLSNWPLKGLKPKSLGDGLEASYKKARRALVDARQDASDANLHELRKNVKDVGYDLRLLAGNRPPRIKTITKRLRDLGERLGDDHDLAMLMAARADGAPPTEADWQALEKAIAARRPRLQHAALRLAAKLLASKPKAFAEFVMSQWKSWRSRRR